MIILVPLVWLVLYQAYSTIGGVFVNLFPKSFEGGDSLALTFQRLVIHYLPVIAIVGVIIWAIMETLKERKRDAFPYD